MAIEFNLGEPIFEFVEKLNELAKEVDNGTEQTTYTLTADDFVARSMNADGDFTTPDTAFNRVVTKDLLPLDSKISVSCPSPYQYFVYYYTGDTTSSYIGKTTWKTGSIEDVANDTVANGTSNGAKYCRISLRDSRATTANLSNRIEEFAYAVTITQNNFIKTVLNKMRTSYNSSPDIDVRLSELDGRIEAYGKRISALETTLLKLMN